MSVVPLVQFDSIFGVSGLFVALDYIGSYLYTEVAEAVLYLQLPEVTRISSHLT